MILSGAALFAAAATACADDSHLSPGRFNFIDQRGYFTPAFKATLRDMVDTQEALKQTDADEKKLTADLPALKKQADEAEAKVADLRKDLVQYDHPEETDFVLLQAAMNNASAKPEDQLPLAQAYIWAYPTSPHTADAQQYLQQLQKKLADQKQAVKDAEAARQAARAKLLQRVQNRDLSLNEWKDFLRDMSQEDILKYLGRPTRSAGQYWVYKGVWTTEPMTGEKVGLRIDFNGTRVLTVTQEPAQ